MTKTERAAREALKPFVRDDLITWGEAGTVLGEFALIEQAVRDNYAPDQAPYYAARTDEAHAHYAAATSLIGRATRLPNLMVREMYEAIYAVVREEKGDAAESVEQAVEVMTEVRDVAREMRLEAFRVTIERFHPNGGSLGAGTRQVQAADRYEAERVAIEETVAAVKAKNARNRASMEATGTTWALDSEDPAHYVVKSVRRAPKKRTAA